jgi:hypothetical protein
VVVESQAGRAAHPSHKSSDPSASSDVSGPSDDEGGKDQCVFQWEFLCSCSKTTTLGRTEAAEAQRAADLHTDPREVCITSVWSAAGAAVTCSRRLTGMATTTSTATAAAAAAAPVP